MTRQPLVAGNWKMNGLKASFGEVEELGRLMGSGDMCVAEVMVCPPATLLAALAPLARTQGLRVGGQDCRPEASGAFTGDISAEMLRDAGADAVIAGHSERRQYHHEDDVLVAAKAKAAWRAGLTAIICIGESQAERDGGKTLAVLERQTNGSVPEGATAENTVVAYEPVWAIGSGKTPSLADIAEAHRAIRSALARRTKAADAMRILYGGSVKPANAADILNVDGVDGALVGGASLKAREFFEIVRTYIR